MASPSAVLSFSTSEIAALAQYFRSIASAGSFPPGSYSGNIADLRAVVSHVDQMFVDSLDPPGPSAPPVSGLESLSCPNDLVSSKLFSYNWKIF